MVMELRGLAVKEQLSLSEQCYGLIDESLQVGASRERTACNALIV